MFLIIILLGNETEAIAEKNIILGISHIKVIEGEIAVNGIWSFVDPRFRILCPSVRNIDSGLWAGCTKEAKISRLQLIGPVPKPIPF